DAHCSLEVHLRGDGRVKSFFSLDRHLTQALELIHGSDFHERTAEEFLGFLHAFLQGRISGYECWFFIVWHGAPPQSAGEDKTECMRCQAGILSACGKNCGRAELT